MTREIQNHLINSNLSSTFLLHSLPPVSCPALCCAGELSRPAKLLTQLFKIRFNKLMEASNAITTLAIAATNHHATSNGGRNNEDVNLGKQMLKGKKSKKKGGRSTNVWKTALLFFLGRRKTTKAIQAEVISDGNNWTMLVGCMRPMNLQDNESTLMLPDATSENDNTKKMSENVMNEVVWEKEETMIVGKQQHEENVNKFPAAITPLLPSSPSSSECSDSRYASALNLQELDKSGSSDDDNEEFDDTQGDAMIDMKAEMFIAQFYAQMRNQNTSSA